MNVTSAIEPAGVGTRMEMPSNLLARDGYACVTAIAAPVEDGIMLSAAALPSRMPFLDGPSTRACVAVYECVVLRIAFSIPTASSRIAMSGAAAFVVQEA